MQCDAQEAFRVKCQLCKTSPQGATARHNNGVREIIEIKKTHSACRSPCLCPVPNSSWATGLLTTTENDLQRAGPTEFKAAIQPQKELIPSKKKWGLRHSGGVGHGILV